VNELLDVADQIVASALHPADPLGNSGACGHLIPDYSL
jgi:hypothetical protein